MTKGEYYHQDSKHTVQCVALDEPRVAEILAEIEPINAPLE